MEKSLVGDGIKGTPDFKSWEDVGGLDGLKNIIGEGKIKKLTMLVSAGLVIALSPGMATETLADQNPTEDVDVAKMGIEEMKELLIKHFDQLNEYYFIAIDKKASIEKTREAREEFIALFKETTTQLKKYISESPNFNKNEKKLLLM
jgi:hypothetical protein